MSLGTAIIIKYDICCVNLTQDALIVVLIKECLIIILFSWVINLLLSTSCIQSFFNRIEKVNVKLKTKQINCLQHFLSIQNIFKLKSQFHDK